MIPNELRRARDAAATRAALLEAATALFSERGYEGTTIRDIGDRARVDPALIARYFGGKAALYLAAVAADRATGEADPDFTNLREYARWLIARVDRSGPGPILQALVRSDSAPEIREAASDRLYERILKPLEAALSENGFDDARLRAEVISASLVGIVLGRSLGSFRNLALATSDELVDVVVNLIDAGTRRHDGVPAK